MSKKILAAALILLNLSCKKSDYKAFTHDPALYRVTVKKLNDIILENGFPPAVASRNYAYANIAAYEVIAAGDSKHFKSLAGQIHELTPGPKPANEKSIDYPFASVLAFCAVGNAVTFPEGSMKEYVEDLKTKAQDAGMPYDVLNASVSYAESVGTHILKWSKTDNYAKTRSASKYSVTNDESRWRPTPPAYAQALEAHWAEIRTLVLDSAAQIRVPSPPAYNMKNREGTFYKNALTVKLIVDSLTQDKKDIADFWDDNAFKLNVVGHASYGTKKFSPAGHWMNIIGIAAQTKNVDFNTTVSHYAKTSIAIFDAFISCWYTKYKTNYVRPETVINKYFDPNWRPYIQTPPFPEYTSGHSTISAAAAEVLSDLYGDNFAFTDTSEIEFGLQKRKFISFRSAALEAGTSRVYGGIHFSNSCLQGTKQGQQIGKLVSKRLKLKK